MDPENHAITRLPLHQAVRCFPTPSARDGRSGKASEATHDRNSRPLNEVVWRMYTTPIADGVGHRKRPYSQGGEALSLQVGGHLNPTWTEWLMGFPLGWTDLEG
jgi:hypothetical protein